MRNLTLLAIGLTCFSSQLKAETFVACPSTSSITCEGPKTDEMHPGMSFWDCHADTWKGGADTVSGKPKFEGEPIAGLDGFSNPVCFYKYGPHTHMSLTDASLHGKNCKENTEKKGFDCPK